MKSKTNWIVITGGPSSGKSAVLGLIDRLVKDRLDCKVIPGAADIIMMIGKARGKTTKEIRADEPEFQRQVLTRKIRVEGELPKDRLTFFDTAIPDSWPYFKVHGLDPQEVLKVCQRRFYKKIFLMEQGNIPFEQDDRRTETPEQVAALSPLFKEVYESLGYKVISVPEMSAIREISIVKRTLFIATQVFEGGD